MHIVQEKIEYDRGMFPITFDSLYVRSLAAGGLHCTHTQTRNVLRTKRKSLFHLSSCTRTRLTVWQGCTLRWSVWTGSSHADLVKFCSSA